MQPLIASSVSIEQIQSYIIGDMLNAILMKHIKPTNIINYWDHSIAQKTSSHLMDLCDNIMDEADLPYNLIEDHIIVYRKKIME